MLITINENKKLQCGHCGETLEEWETDFFSENTEHSKHDDCDLRAQREENRQRKERHDTLLRELIEL